MMKTSMSKYCIALQRASARTLRTKRHRKLSCVSVSVVCALLICSCVCDYFNCWFANGWCDRIHTHIHFIAYKLSTIVIVGGLLLFYTRRFRFKIKMSTVFNVGRLQSCDSQAKMSSIDYNRPFLINCVSPARLYLCVLSTKALPNTTPTMTMTMKKIRYRTWRASLPFGNGDKFNCHTWQSIAGIYTSKLNDL